LADFEVDGEGGEDSLLRLLCGEIVLTASWTSARGRHYLFIIPDGRALLALLGAAGARERKGIGQSGTWHLDALPGLELRIGGLKADGTPKQFQSVCPPTIGSDGKPREWVVPPDAGIATLPEAAIVFLEDLAERAAIQEEGAGGRGTTELATPSPTKATWTPGRSYGEAALAGECGDIERATEGTRHNTCRDSAIKIATLAKSGALDWEHARGRLLDAARRCGLPDSEAIDLIESAWRKAAPQRVRKATHTSYGRGGCWAPDRKSMCHTAEPRGVRMERIESRVSEVTIPPALAAKPRLAGQARALVAYDEEARRCGQSTFPADARKLAVLSGIGEGNFKTALRRCKAFGKLGYLSLVRPGISGIGPTGRAHVYRWHDPPRPGEAVWNDNAVVVDVVQFLTESQPREVHYLKLFEVVDPGQQMTIPALLSAVALQRAKEAMVAVEQGRAADVGRSLDDAVCCAGIAEFILNEPDATVRSRLQDLDDRGLARLIELVDVRSGHPESIEEVAAFLGGVKGEILAAIDKLQADVVAGPHQGAAA
jgi:hypothetical protein